MASYYFIDPQRQRRGPIEESQFLGAGVTADTYVWKVGMEQWEKAGTVPSLRYIFVGEAGVPPRPSTEIREISRNSPPRASTEIREISRHNPPRASTVIREISRQQSTGPDAGQQQPQYAQAPYQQPSVCPPTYLAWAIVSTLLCCLPFGIVAIVYASKVSGLWAQGRYDEAQRASNTAKNWVIAAVVCALVYYAAAIGLIAVAGAI